MAAGCSRATSSLSLQPAAMSARRARFRNVPAFVPSRLQACTKSGMRKHADDARISWARAFPTALVMNECGMNE